MRYKSYESYREAWDGAFTKTPEIPLNIDIELSSVCNLRCPFCFLSDPKTKKNKNDFFIVYWIIQIFKEIKKEGIPAIKFNWMGEPTLHPLFNEIMEAASKLGCYDLLINTNGNYKPEINKGLMYATKVMFSVDSFNSVTYKKMRRGGDLKKVIRNIRELTKMGHKNIVVRRVITADNKNEDFEKDVYQNLGLYDCIKFSEHYVFDRNTSSENHEKTVNKISRTYCGYPSQRLIIDTDLNVFSCCADYNKNMLLGNIKDNSIIEIWRSKKLEDIREKLKKNIMPSDSCKNCTSFLAYDMQEKENVKK